LLDCPNVQVIFDEMQIFDRIQKNETYKIFFFNEEDWLETGLLGL